MFRLLGPLVGAATILIASFSQSTNYKLQNYNLGSGGTDTAGSATYRLNASSGEISGTSSSGGGHAVHASSIQAQQANVPAAPTLDNGSNSYYNKLNCTINKGGTDATDYTYAIAVSTTSNFSSINYVQADGSLGSTMVYRTYSAWGGASGSFITGLQPNTAYYVKVAAMQAKFTNSAFGPSATQNTVNPSVTFSLSPASISIGNLLAGSVISAGTNISMTFATNAASGGNIYLAGQYGGLKSAATNYLLAAVSADLSLVGQSEGYGTRGASASATSGTLSFVAPYNGAGSNVGAPGVTFSPFLTSSAPLAGGTATANLMAKASTTTPAGGDYTDTLTFVASASF